MAIFRQPSNREFERELAKVTRELELMRKSEAREFADHHRLLKRLIRGAGGRIVTQPSDKDTEGVVITSYNCDTAETTYYWSGHADTKGSPCQTNQGQATQGTDRE